VSDERPWWEAAEQTWASGVPAPVSARADAARARLASVAWPTTTEEDWRYSRIEEVDAARFAPAVGDGAPGCSDAAGALEATGAAGRLTALDLPALLDRAALVGALIDGTLLGGGAVSARPGATLRLASAPEDLGLLPGPGEGPDPFWDLAEAAAQTPVLLEVAGDVELAGPVVLVDAALQSDAASFPTLAVRLAPGARAVVVHFSVSGQGERLVVPRVVAELGEGAELVLLEVQDHGQETVQLGYQTSVVAASARLVSFSVALGGSYARQRTSSVVAGPGARSELLAAYLGLGKQMHDFRTYQVHQAPRTTSDLLFQGALGGASRSVYSGLIRIAKGARRSDAFQTNRNLVLSSSAGAESVPNLDIEENDVRCSHASTIGPIDPEQRFYLQSRGVPPAAADRLVVRGFFRQVLDRLALEEMASALVDVVAGRFDADAASSSGPVDGSSERSSA
jgi:Fe-S cluster assembly protein SufD